ncbi:response regulator [Rhizobium calliandrae]|uniref:histidine kinase n=1 Tax=Rhizobium calliandrae TaxID=1312182 RepID=A0ABT7KPZ7_9HYPH|nr:response regulator [Rhizobium calliandrae]MDL2409339.1 response regulator [Rhizobium calliandrae]
MNSDGELLEMACRRIADLDQPAYVKNSDLRYVAVNEAYARFFGRDISDFIGSRSRDLFDSGEEVDREDKERRALVFGSEEMALCFDPTGRSRSRVQIESFSPSQDRLYVFGMFLDAPVMPSSAPKEDDILGSHVDEIGVYRTILEDLPVATFVRDASHRLIYSNEAYAAITGLSRAEVLGKTEHEMFETGADDFFTQNEQVLNEGRGLEFEGEVVDRLHMTHPIMTRVNRVVASDGTRYIVGSMTDISVLKLRETELIEAQARAEALHQDLENILRSMPIGVMIHDSNYVVEYTNDAFYDIWDFPKHEHFEGLTYRDLVAKHFELGRYDADAGSIDDIYQARVEALRHAGPHFQTEMNFADGKSVIMDARRISNGRTLVAYADISSVRQQAREISEARLALEHLGELMTDATHAMSQGLLIVQDGIIMLASDALTDMLRVPPDYLEVGKHWSIAFDHCAARGDFGDEPEALRLSWRESMAANKPVSAVFQVAGERWMQLEATISESRRWTVVLTDVTEMKEREAELQLLLSRSETADRAKSEFLANMSHEIRTPMNGVLGMAELLAKTDLDARQKTFIDIIVKSGNALLTIINDILDFSKIDAGKMRLRKAAFDPAEAVEDVATLLSSPAAEKDIELLVRTAPDVPAMVLADAGRFRQIVTNLVGNAVKFTERGHVLVDLNSQPIDNGEIMLSLRIEDTGIGIADEKLDSIFEKFSQVDASSTRRHEGTGLGLAITAGLVDLFGGYLEVESVWGKGSVFTVHLPVSQAATRSEPRVVPVNVKGAGILVVDDNEINRRILTEQLEQWGFDGYAAEDGKTGLAILNAAFDMGVPVDAVILDYHMPEMNGDDVARAIRAEPRFNGVSLIFLTSMDVASNDKEFAALNGQAHLMKPTRANVLRSTIIDIVRKARRQAMSSDEPTASPQLPVAAEAVAAIEAVERGVAKPVSAIDILVAEDNEVNQIVFTQILQVTGLRFLVVQNGQEAVEAWQKLRPSLIMMDVSMPIMNGHQATRMIRQLEADAGQGWHVPIVGVTAHALDVDRDMCLEAGMDDYMSKPISPELLEAKARRWLGDAALGKERSTN